MWDISALGVEVFLVAWIKGVIAEDNEEIGDGFEATVRDIVIYEEKTHVEV